MALSTSETAGANSNGGFDPRTCIDGLEHTTSRSATARVRISKRGIDMQTVSAEQGVSQGVGTAPPALSSQDPTLAENISPSDRRLLLAASFGLFLFRIRHGLTVWRGDVLRVADLADRDAGAA